MGATLPASSAGGAPDRSSLAQALSVFGEMRRAGLTPDRASYNALLEACAKARDAAASEKVLCAMVGDGIAPDVIT